MAKKKRSAAAAAGAAPKVPATSSNASTAPSISSFPMAKYATIIPTHTLLLLFTVTVLPRSSEMFFPLPPPSSSLDHPQPKWMEPITASPPWTMLWVVLGTWACLGAWAGSLRSWAVEVDKIPPQKAAFALGNAVMALLVSTPVFFGIIVLFGAPLTNYIVHTTLLGFLLSLLTIYVPSYILPPPSFQDSALSIVSRLTWVRLFSEFSIRTEIERALVYPAVGAVVGCWIGAMPIALDWDRPWQAWPLTPAYGAVLGYIIAAWIALIENGTRSLAEVGSVRKESAKSFKKTL